MDKVEFRPHHAARKSLTLASRVLFFKAAIMPDLLYGSVAFSPGLTQAQTDRLQVAQNRGARAVYGRPGFSRASDLLERMQVFRIGEVHRQKVLVFVWRCIHASASPFLQELFVRCADRRTRLDLALGLREPAPDDLALPPEVVPFGTSYRMQSEYCRLSAASKLPSYRIPSDLPDVMIRNLP